MIFEAFARTMSKKIIAAALCISLHPTETPKQNDIEYKCVYHLFDHQSASIPVHFSNDLKEQVEYCQNKNQVTPLLAIQAYDKRFNPPKSVGYAFFSIDTKGGIINKTRYLHLDLLNVDENYRRKGIATQMTKAGETITQPKDFSLSDGSNISNFYEKLGFTVKERWYCPYPFPCMFKKNKGPLPLNPHAQKFFNTLKSNPDQEYKIPKEFLS